jgi:hypothetical protein
MAKAPNPERGRRQTYRQCAAVAHPRLVPRGPTLSGETMSVALNDVDRRGLITERWIASLDPARHSDRRRSARAHDARAAATIGADARPNWSECRAPGMEVMAHVN